MLKKLLVVLLALILIATPALATCPTTWNDPNLTCITTNNWLQFVGNWTYWNSAPPKYGSTEVRTVPKISR